MAYNREGDRTASGVPAALQQPHAHSSAGRSVAENVPFACHETERSAVIQRLLRNLTATRDARGVAERPEAKGSGTIAGLHIDAIWAVRSDSLGSALNKDGQLVLAGRMNDSPVKIYEARSSDQAAFIQAVSRHPAVGALFPNVLAIDGPVVVAEWIEGESTASSLDRIVDVQERLHAVVVSELPLAGFDYWKDYLEPRFRRALRVLGTSPAVEEALSHAGQLWSRSAAVLMNPDVTPDNLLVDGAGRLRLVDCGDLTTGGLPWLDVLNTANALPADQRQPYVDHYLARDASPPSGEQLRALSTAWLARAVGSHYVAGRLRTAGAMLEAFSAGDSVFPAALGASVSRPHEAHSGLSADRDTAR